MRCAAIAAHTTEPATTVPIATGSPMARNTSASVASPLVIGTELVSGTEHDLVRNWFHTVGTTPAVSTTCTTAMIASAFLAIRSSIIPGRTSRARRALSWLAGAS
jgi:hypothetical protein